MTCYKLKFWRTISKNGFIGCFTGDSSRELTKYKWEKKKYYHGLLEKRIANNKSRGLEERKHILAVEEIATKGKKLKNAENENVNFICLPLTSNF